MENTPLLLGVDGGGTKTEAWLAQAAPHAAPGVEPAVLGRGLAASSNPRAVGLNTALTHLAAAIDAAWRDANRPPRPVDVAVLAISGAGQLAIQHQIRAWAERRHLAARVDMVHDADAVLAAGAPEAWGVAAIVGTGSAAIGVDRAGRRHVVGGWGYWFGDEGSAYWIGRRALETMARAADGRCAATQLTAAILARHAIDDPRAALAALEATGNVRSAIAALAPLVVETAAAGDAAAAQILAEAAAELAASIACVAERLALGRDFPLALAGGVACGSELLRTQLAAALAERQLAPRSITLAPHPVAGCLRLAHMNPIVRT